MVIDVPVPLDIRIVADLAPPDWWSIGLTSVAGILGAIIGAGISYAVARQTAKEGRISSEEARREDEKLATYRVGLKLMELVNSSAGYHLTAERAIMRVKAALNDEELEAWRGLQPFIGHPMEIETPTNDLTAFWRAGALNYITKLMFLFNSYNSMIYAVEAYSIRRQALFEKITPDQMNGLIGSVTFSEEQARALNPEIQSVRDLADQVRQQMKEVHDEATEVMTAFKPIVREYFNDPKFPAPALANTKVKPTTGPVPRN